MNFSPIVIESLLSASSKALATTGDAGLNVVPVSSVKVVDGTIYLVDYFFGKTRTNIQTSTEASLVFWDEYKGFQVKGSIEYTTSGNEFDMIKQWIKETIPTRTVKGVLILKPKDVFDISIDTLI